MNEVKLFDGVIGVLDYLSKKTKVGLLTNSTDIKCQRRRIEKSGLTQYFHEICIAGDICKYKPNAEAFIEIANRLKENIENIVFIGDSEYYDIAGSKNAGMYAIKKDNHGITETKADQRFISFYDLEKRLKEIWG